MTKEMLDVIAKKAEDMGAVAIRGVIQVKAGSRANEGTVSTYMDAPTAAKFGIGRAGTVTCYLDLDTIEALCEEANLRPLAVASLIVTQVQEKQTAFLDAAGKPKTRISGVLLGIEGVEGGLKKGYNFDNLRHAAELNAKLATAAAAPGGVTLGA